MATFEENGVIVSDDECEKPTPKVKTTPTEGKEEKNASNNSTVERAGQQNGGKSAKPRGNRKAANEKPSDQRVRREDMLAKMKGKQYVYTQHTQSFLNALMRPSIDVRDVKTKVYKNQLMMSESMEELPTSFAKNWLMVVCPLGSRCLVVASRGYTGAYTKTGYHIISHPSSLPMGNKMFQGYGPCVLDCIYCNETETYYVLDIMCWDGQALYGLDTQTRFKLMNDRVRELDLSRPSPMNPYPLIPLKAFTPTKNNIHGAVTMAPYVIDGLIFYHKQLTYGSGSTPLMLWLTLDRLPTKMKIEIPEMGIFSTVSYKDPVSLALAHGVSPAIISQVYPGNRGNNGRRDRDNQKGRPASAGAKGRQFQQQQQQGYSSPLFGQGFDQGGAMMRGGPMHNFPGNDFSFMNDMMMNMNLQGAGQNAFGNYGMMHQTRPFQRGYNGNNNNSTGFYQPIGFRRQFPHQFVKLTKQQKKKKHQAAMAKKDELKVSNWSEPHAVMRSQWMESKPEDFEADYLTCICPMSKRRIIVAAKGSTCLYNKFGKLIDTYTSTLPNGSPNAQSKASEELTILDCLWCGSFQKFFVIDVMHWRSQPFYESEAEFRFFSMSDKIAGIKLKAGKREYGLEILPKYPSDQASLTDALSKADFKVDGLLSFQRKSQYSGANASWVKLDMLPELLGYAAPKQVNFKASTEKERKQRAYFMGLNKGETTKEGEASPAQISNGDNAE